MVQQIQLLASATFPIWWWYYDEIHFQFAFLTIIRFQNFLQAQGFRLVTPYPPLSPPWVGSRHETSPPPLLKKKKKITVININRWFCCKSTLTILRRLSGQAADEWRYRLRNHKLGWNGVSNNSWKIVDEMDIHCKIGEPTSLRWMSLCRCNGERSVLWSICYFHI